MKYVYVYLTGDTTNFKFAEPGALSRARFMGKLLYAIPMVLMKDKISSELGKEAAAGDKKVGALELKSIQRTMTAHARAIAKTFSVGKTKGDLNEQRC